MPLAHLLWLAVFLDFCFFVRRSAELCAGSLVSGWNSMSRVSQFTMLLGADVISSGGQNVSCGMLVASVWHLGGPSTDPVGLRSTRRETLGSRLGFLSILGGSKDRILRVFSHLWNNKCVSC